MWRKRKKKQAPEKQFASRFTTKDQTISHKVQTNLDYLSSNYLTNTDDFVFFPLEEKFGVAYIETLANDKKVKQILNYLRKAVAKEETSMLEQLPFSYKKETSFKHVIQALTRGNFAVFVSNSKEAIIIDILDIKERAIEEPAAEATIKGPREGFTESFQTNISLIRKRIFSHRLKVEKKKAGTISQTEIVLMYLDGVASEEIINEIKKRLSRIELDAVQSSNQIQSFIKDHSYAIVPLVGSSERPDKIAANIMEGKIAILVDGSPFVLYGPISMFSLLQAPDDYYDSMYIATLLRMIRFAALFVTLLLPSLYIALTTFHQEMIPTALALSIAAGRETVPFPALIETLFMEIIFEFLREAGLRLPKAIGNTISIVGALVIGDAAVRAGFVSPLVIIIVSITAISSFIIPNYSLGVSFRILRFVFIFLSASFGFFGIVWGLLGLYLYLSSLRSFGYPYLAPHAPLFPKGLNDTIFRFPLFQQARYQKFTVDQPSLKRFPSKLNPGKKYRKKDD
ncbi:spore germination protein [Sediminibacillus halophilus]|uniref:Spore germination protein KA n=1 Tax=Sediminibacillus halophilus TaxID=482461 RepID=A0A1G9P750_9BACI|nr:spore germination protein [Sediminibacillus halophilus]SDL94628.1 spore germination protein KA [Sediminibacillus halophilus]